MQVKFMNVYSPRMTKPFHLPLSLLLIGILVYGIWDIQFASKPCDPQAAHAQLKTFSEKGIRNTGHGSSLSNLLWIYVDQKWYALSKNEKLSVDKVVTCAAMRIDSQGQPTWQAAYYDHKSGKMAALTSKRYGFRIKIDESSDAPGWDIP